MTFQPNQKEDVALKVAMPARWPVLKRMRVNIRMTSNTGSSLEWDGSSHRQELVGGKRTTIQRSEPNKVLIDAVDELARIAALAGIPLAELRTTVSTSYKRVEEWREKQTK